ncbi:unnamed protein product [Rotaria sp. Silwood2]|nr:unnamed protein product [Rotaria sp. Silwood2]CAF2965398.1 unnamed protein product [Rotaria sp. Silwood2]CAF4268661.1 unnamed protein product [Rotaria sp. Silwood2]CAF4327104.1 unnamed protein product [Rotaria sp. Silwood2]
MNSILNFDISSITYRRVEKHEQQQVVDLVCPIFKTNPDMEKSYFSLDASPCYQEGDTLGAWQNDKLVSVVHIRRLALRSNETNEKYSCGGFGNVATVDKYRRRGLSRHLLRMAIDRMEKNNEFDISMLSTEKPNHYTVLGWESVPRPSQIIINWKNITSSSINAEWRSASNISSEDIELLLKIHSNNPRIYQIDRSPSTLFQHWVKKRWQNNAAIVCLYEHEEEQGYVVIGKPDSEKDICVLEWCAPNFNLETKLLSLAAIEIRQRYGSTKPICLLALPQYMKIDELTEWAGPLQIKISKDLMMRNIRLPKEVYEKIKLAYSEGRAVFWIGDYF